MITNKSLSKRQEVRERERSKLSESVKMEKNLVYISLKTKNTYNNIYFRVF